MVTPTQRGITLIELLVTVSVATIVLAVGVPSMTTMSRTNRAAAYTNDFLVTLYAARGEAVKNAVRVTICKSADQTSCDATLDWHDGWIVFADSDADGTRDLGGTPELLLRVHGPLEGGSTLQSVAFDDWIGFRPTGLVIGSGGNAGTFSLCHEAGAQFGRDINIARTGSPAAGPNADGACP